MPAAAEATGRITFIGNATVLLEWGDLRILTDPNFIHRHEQVSVAPGVNTTRQHDPAMEIEDLPPLDLVVLSHFHGDHFDQVAERELDRSLPIITTHEASRELEQRGFSNVGLFHLGGTKVLGVMVTMDAEQGVEAVRLINPRTAIPIHYDDYDVFTSGLEAFLDAATDAGIRERVHELRRGDTHQLRS